MGVKPLYYYWDGSYLLFASEIKALLASRLVKMEINRQSVWDYLTYRYIPGPESIWKGVRKLPPGHALRFSRGSAPKEVKYWSTDVISTNGSGGDQETDREFANLFLDAVQLRLVAADVPVGVLLSGGLDSSAVAAAAVELGHRNFHTFSIGFDDERYSELRYARLMADQVGSQHHEIVIGQKRFLELLPEVVKAADEPLADLASVPLLEVCRLARANVKVVLSGEGSDELLAGYDLERAERKWQLVRSLQGLPAPLLNVAAAAIGVVAPSRALGARRVASVNVADWNRVDLAHMTWLLGQTEKQKLWPNEEGVDSARILKELYANAKSSDPLQQVLSVYQKSWLVEELLMKADKMSMATSIELRTPFLDYRLVEWANAQPNATKVRRIGLSDYQSKSVLRRFCARRIPAEILTRPKRGFPVPAYEWLKQSLSGWARDMLLGPETRSGRAFQPSVVDALLKGAAAGDSASAHNTWSLLILEQWLRSWDVEL